MSRAILRLSLQVSGVLKYSDVLTSNCKFIRTKNFYFPRRSFADEKEPSRLPTVQNFELTEDKSKAVFLEMLNNYKVREVHRRSHVEFIYGAMKYMKEFGVEKDLQAYKEIIDVMPKGKFVPENFIQAEFMHFPKQQFCIINLLEKMEYNGVIPDPELGQMLINIFGERGYPVRKFMRMLYWMPKFKNLSPWPLPSEVPREPFDLAMLAIKRITSVDPATIISVHSTRDVDDSVDDTWIISGQSKEQQELLMEHDKDSPIHVEGAHRIWLRNVSVCYFVLRGKPRHTEEESSVDVDDVSSLNIKNAFFAPPASELSKVPSVHEQEDGVYYAVCCTGSSSKDSLLSWVRILQKNNPRLGEVPILFKFRSPSQDLVPVNNVNEAKEQSKNEKENEAKDESKSEKENG